MPAPNDAPETRTITMSQFQWGQLDLLVRDEQRKQMAEEMYAKKAPDRKVARARVDELGQIAKALREHLAVTLGDD